MDLDPLTGISDGYASTFKDSLEAQLLTVAGQHAPALMTRLLAGSREVIGVEAGILYCRSGTRPSMDLEALS